MIHVLERVLLNPSEYPEKLMGPIKKAFRDDLIDSCLISYDDFERALNDGKEKCLQRIRTELQDRFLDNLYSRMSWWACFRTEKPSAATQDSAIESQKTSKNRTKKKKKTKANKSKKKKRS